MALVKTARLATSDPQFRDSAEIEILIALVEPAALTQNRNMKKFRPIDRESRQELRLLKRNVA